jgi:hypothetical protein
MYRMHLSLFLLSRKQTPYFFLIVYFVHFVYSVTLKILKINKKYFSGGGGQLMLYYLHHTNHMILYIAVSVDCNIA